MASISTPTAATGNKLIEAMTLDAHQSSTQHYPHIKDVRYNDVRISYFLDGKHMISGSGARDNIIRRWDLQTGEEIEEARIVCDREVYAVAVSKDSRWVAFAEHPIHASDGPSHGKLKAYEVTTRITKTFEGHSPAMMSIDISMDSKLLASGSHDGKVRIWSLDTGRLMAGPIESKSAHLIGTVRFSQDSKKLAVLSASRRCLEVWDVETQTLDGSVGNLRMRYRYAPVLGWTTKDRTVVAAFTLDDNLYPAKIYEFDASTLKTVGAPFEGHSNDITSLALSFDCALLVSTSYNNVKLWAFESRQILASFEIHNLFSLTLSPDSRQLAYTTFECTKIHICNIPPDILARIWPEKDARNIASAHATSRLADLLNSDATRSPLPVTVPRNPVASPLTYRPSSTIQIQPSFIRYLRTLFSSSFRRDTLGNDEPHDPLDFPATLSRPPNHSHLTQGMAQERSELSAMKNPNITPVQAITVSLPTATTTCRARLRHPSHWLPINARHAPRPVVDVPFAQGKERNAAAGAPNKRDDDCIPEEDYDPSSSPPPPNSNLQQPSTVAPTNNGEHGSGCFPFCLWT